MIIIAKHGESSGLQGIAGFLIVNMDIQERRKISRLGWESICTLLSCFRAYLEILLPREVALAAMFRFGVRESGVGLRGLANIGGKKFNCTSPPA